MSHFSRTGVRHFGNSFPKISTALKDFKPVPFLCTLLPNVNLCHCCFLLHSVANHKWTIVYWICVSHYFISMWQKEVAVEMVDYFWVEVLGMKWLRGPNSHRCLSCFWVKFAISLCNTVETGDIYYKLLTFYSTLNFLLFSGNFVVCQVFTRSDYYNVIVNSFSNITSPAICWRKMKLQITNFQVWKNFENFQIFLWQERIWTSTTNVYCR